MAQFDHWYGAAPIEEKALAEQSDYWVLTGYAATWDRDRVDDVIVPGAFKKSLERMAAKNDNLQLYFNHKLDAPPIGSVVECTEDAKGLKYTAHLPKDDTFVAGQIVPQIKRRSLKSNSFGYRVRESERSKDGATRIIKRLDIFEISVVGMPANPAAVIERIKGLVPFQDLPINRDAKSWDAAAALARIKAAFGDRDEDVRRAFLFAEEGKSVDELDPRLLIADIDEDRGLQANQIALYKIGASLCGARGKDGSKLILSEDAAEAVKSHLDRYYQRLDLGGLSSLSDGEFDVLDAGEREARLKSLGVSRKLATKLSGLRDADRKTAQRDAGPSEDAKSLLTAFTSILEAAAAIKQQPAG